MGGVCCCGEPTPDTDRYNLKENNYYTDRKSTYDEGYENYSNLTHSEVQTRGVTLQQQQIIKPPFDYNGVPLRAQSELSGQTVISTANPNLTVEHLQRVRTILNDPMEFSRLGMAWFGKYDMDNSGDLDEIELKHLMMELSTSLGIPDVNPHLLRQLLLRFNTSGSGRLQPQEFLELYQAMLIRINDSFVA